MAGAGQIGSEGAILPKSGKSKDWLAYADKKEKEFQNYHSATNLFGQLRNPPPLTDDYSKMLSDHALQARKMGMDLLRQEQKRQGAQVPGYRKGGRVKKTGPAKLHRGEVVVRNKKRSKSRSKARSSSR